MMPNIIALRGKGNSGKTTTIKKVRQHLLDAGFQSTPELYNPETSDFVDFLVRGKQNIGITSCGDTDDILETMLGRIVKYKAPLIVCACRTFGATNDILKDFSHNIEFVEKEVTKDGAMREQVNKSDALLLLDIVLAKL